MVATKQGNGPRKPPPKQGNANRRFKPPVMNGNKQQHQQHRLIPPQMQQLPRFNTRAAAAGISAMFNTNQMLDNPGYVDFNEPTPQRQPIPAKNPPKQTQSGNNNSNKNNRGMRRSNQPNMKHMPPPPPQRNQNNTNGWNPPRMPPSQMSQQHPPPPPPPHGGRNFRNPPMPRLGGRPMPPPMGMRPPMCPPPPPPPNMTPGRFGPRPLIPPPLAGCPPLVPLPMGPPRLPIRGGPMPPRPLLPRGGVVNGPLPSGGGGGPIRRGKILPNNRKNMKNRKRPIGNGNSGPPINSNGNKNTVQVKKSTTTRKTLSEIVNQYPLDKPWVTDEIRAEQKKKDDIENRLKGHKDDKLFAEFKVQRDKFVKMYETARLEYIGKHPEQDIDKILTESSDKNKGETNANTKAKPNDNRKTNEKSAAT